MITEYVCNLCCLLGDGIFFCFSCNWRRVQSLIAVPIWVCPMFLARGNNNIDFSSLLHMGHFFVFSSDEIVCTPLRKKRYLSFVFPLSTIVIKWERIKKKEEEETWDLNKEKEKIYTLSICYFRSVGVVSSIVEKTNLSGECELRQPAISSKEFLGFSSVSMIRWNTIKWSLSPNIFFRSKERDKWHQYLDSLNEYQKGHSIHVRYFVFFFLCGFIKDPSKDVATYDGAAVIWKCRQNLAIAPGVALMKKRSPQNEKHFEIWNNLSRMYIL